jgi:hypothetical protein
VDNVVLSSNVGSTFHDEEAIKEDIQDSKYLFGSEDEEEEEEEEVQERMNFIE